MRQFILPEDWNGGPECFVRGGRARYLLRILGLRTSDHFVGMDSSGTRWLCSLRDYGSEDGVDLLRLKIDPLPDDFEPSSLRDLRGRSGLPPSEPVPLAESTDAGFAADSSEGREGFVSEHRPPPSITLIQGLPKGSKMDLMSARRRKQACDESCPCFLDIASPKQAEMPR